MASLRRKRWTACFGLYVAVCSSTNDAASVMMCRPGAYGTSFCAPSTLSHRAASCDLCRVARSAIEFR